MTIFKKAKDGDSVRSDNVVVGHFEDMAIIKNEENELFFFYGSSDELELGMVVENEYLTPISNLTPLQQKQIKKQFL